MVLTTRFVHFRIYPLSKKASIAHHQNVMEYLGLLFVGSFLDPGHYGTGT